MLLVSASVACDNDGPKNQGPVTDAAPQEISLKQLTQDWFAQAPNDTPPSPNGLNIVDDTQEDPNTFDNLLTTGQSGNTDTN